MLKRINHVLIVLVIGLISFCTWATEPSPVPGNSNNNKIIVLDKKFFVIHYDTKVRLAAYVEYTLTAEHLKKGCVKRHNNFHKDNELVTDGLSPVEPADYAHTGYDKGHLAPSGDFRWSNEADEATFIMSNMTPQKPKLNRAAWEGLEEAVRGWACVVGKLQVITGPIIESNLSKTESGVTIPKKFFKIVLDEERKKAIGFLMNQGEATKTDYLHDHVPVREVERQTGLRFFGDLPEKDRENIEADDDLSEWKGAKCAATECGAGD